MIGAVVLLPGRSVGYVVQENGCWDWVGCTNYGYGLMGYGASPHYKSSYRAHRYYYELEYGPIPEGLVIDHLCCNRKCVRPDHLEAVTRRENTLRGTNPAAMRARRTHCPQRHAYTPENIRWEGRKRHCITCDLALQSHRKR